MAEIQLNQIPNPAVSIIISVFNRSRLLKRAIKSLFDQSFKDFEVIVIDDGSNDKTYIYPLSIINEHSNVKYIKHSNRNTPLSLNTGIRLSSGKYVTFLDSDDEYSREHLEIRFNFLERNKSVDLIHSNASIIGNKEEMYIPDARNPSKLIHIKNCIIGATIFAKRNVFFEMKGFKNIYGYDYDFIKRCKKKFNVFKLEVPTYIYYRNSADSVLTKLKRKKGFFSSVNQNE